MKNRYFLMRHGESQANRAGLIVSDPSTGCKLYGLTSEGRDQARQSAQKSGLDHQTLIVCSDFLRTRETAREAAKVLGVSELQTHTGLRERYFGELEGESGERYKEVWKRDSQDSVHTLFGAESPAHLAQRLQKTLQELESQHEGKTLLLVSHGDTLRFLQLAAAERPLTEHMEVALFEPAEIRALHDLPPAKL